MKKVLFVIPDKSYKSQDFVNSANKLGIDMVIITDSEQAAQQLGAKNIFSMEFDTLSKEKLNDLPQDIKLALPVDHSSVLFASKIVDELGIEGNSIESVENCLYKERTRLKLTNINQLQPRFIKAKSLNEINKFREKINSKIIIKPNDGVASIGVMSVDEKENRDTEIHNIINSCTNKEVVVEEFFEGQEYAYEGYLKEGKLNKIVIFEKPGDYSGPYFEEKIFIAPSDLDNATVNQIQKVCQSACTELGITVGPVHIEFKIINDKIFIIEVNPRTIGGLCSRSLNFNLFRNSLETVILSDLVNDKQVSLNLASNSTGVLMLSIPEEGIFKGIKNIEKAKKLKEIVNIEISLPIDTHINKPPFSERYLGFVFANGESNAETKNALLECEDLLEPIIE